MNKRKPSPTVRHHLRRINSTPVPGDRMMEFAEAVEALPEADRDWEGMAITGVKLFAGEGDMGFSATFRMEALARIVTEEKLLGWSMRPETDGPASVHRALLQAAGCAPVFLDESGYRFRRRSFLRLAFQCAKEDRG